MGSKRIAGVIAALAVVALSGCAEEKGADLPPVTSSPQATSTSPSPPVVGGRAGVPDDAKRHTRAGAENFLRYYFEVVNLAYTTAEPAVLDGLGGEECGFCSRVRAQVQELADRDRHSVGDVVEIREFGPHGDPSPTEEFFKVRFVQFGTNTVDASGKVVDTDPKQNRTVYGRTLWEHDEWYFMGLQSDP